MTITEFLLARLAEDEAAARSCPPWPWRVATIEDEAAVHDEQTYAGDTVAAADGICVAVPYALSGRHERAVRDHIPRHDPARVLREVEAKRAIVEAHERNPLSEDVGPEWGDTCYTCVSDHEPLDWPCATLRHLASIYSDHPEFDAGWAP